MEWRAGVRFGLGGLLVRVDWGERQREGVFDASFDFCRGYRDHSACIARV